MRENCKPHFQQDVQSQTHVIASIDGDEIPDQMRLNSQDESSEVNLEKKSRPISLTVMNI
jgi:hypothetical protein